MTSDERLKQYAERLLLIDERDWHTDVERAVEILKEFLEEADA